MSSPLLLLCALALATAACAEATPPTTVEIAPGQPPPVELVPDVIESPPVERPAPPVQSAEGPIEVTVDNIVDAEEWAGAATYAGDGELIEAVHYGFGAAELYLRIDFVDEILGNDQIGLDIYLDAPGSGQKRTMSLLGTPLGFGATSMVAWRGSNPIVAEVAATLPPEPEGTAVFTDSLVTGFDGWGIELALPRSMLGDLGPSEILIFRVVPRNLIADIRLVPDSGPAAVRVPDITA